MNTIKTVCSLCHQMCGINIEVENGRVIGVSPMVEHERHLLCEKAYALPEIVHSPDRLTEPLVKKNGKFQKVTWDEALDYVAAALLKIRDRYGAKALVTHSGFAFVRSYAEYVERRLCDLYGTPNFTTGGSICYLARTIAYVLTCGAFLNPDYDEGLPYSRKTKCLIVWGNNPDESNVPLHGQGIRDAVANGSKLIVVDPRSIALVKKADIHAQIRPGTDGALALGMLNVIINEDLYDKDFVRDWVTGFEEFSEYVQEFSPEQVETITWVPAETIRAMARMYAGNTPAAISVYVAMDHHTNAVQSLRAITALIAITGNLDVPGGNTMMPGLRLSRMMTNLRFPERVPNPLEESVGADYPMYFRQAGMPTAIPVVDQMASQKPYPIKALLIAGNNAFLTWPNTTKFVQGRRNLDLMVVVDIYMTDTAKMADVVLPGTTFLERPEIRDYLGQGAALATLGNQVIKPIGNCRQEWWIWAELGRKMGYAEHFPWQDAEALLEHLLEPSPFTLKELKENAAGIYYLNKEYRKYLKNGFATPSGKIELYSQTLQEHGYDPLPVFSEPVESPVSRPELAKNFPLFLLGAHKRRAYTHSQHRNIPQLRKIVPEPLLEIHPDTARRCEVNDGDWVIVESARGRIKLKAKFSEELHPQIVAMMYGWSEANVNYLTDDTSRDPISGFPNLRCILCRVEKAKDLNPDHSNLREPSC